MTTFTWKVKYLKEDERGYAVSLFCELQGTVGNVNKVSSNTFSFGGEDYKPKTQWTQEQIDQWVDICRPDLEQNINAQFETI